MDAREERIKAKADDLWKSDGSPEGQERRYWTQAAKLVEEEERRVAQAANDPTKQTDPKTASPTSDPIGVTLGAMKRQG